MKKRFFLFALLVPIIMGAQVMDIQKGYDISYPNIEVNPDYGFVWPVAADVLDDSSYTPQFSNRYFMSLFGPRYKSTSTSNVGYFDFHQGEDFTSFVNYNGQVYTDSNKYYLICMCEGVINSVDDSTDAYLETTGNGRSVRVKCDSSYRANPSWGQIYINYRHLSDLHTITDSAKQLPINTVRVSKGDTIGIVGESGITSTVHLHLSIARSDNGLKNVHPMRIFPPNRSPLLHTTLDSVNIELHHTWSDSALFRLIIPYNQVNIRSIEIKNQSYSRIYDFESISDSSNRDHNNLVSGLKLYAYSFNRGSTALSRYNSTKGTMPAIYPASPNKNSHSSYTHVPITTDTTAYILDIMASELPNGYEVDSFRIIVRDIYGNYVEGFYKQASTVAVKDYKKLNKLRVYPNPVTNHITIIPKNITAKYGVYRIFDANGIEVYETQKLLIDNNGTKLYNLDLAAGQYTIVLDINGDYIFSSKFIITK